MALGKRKSLPVDVALVQRSRRVLKSPSDAAAVQAALEEALANREIERTLIKLIREGRGRFVDLYAERS